MHILSIALYMLLCNMNVNKSEGIRELMMFYRSDDVLSHFIWYAKKISSNLFSPSNGVKCWQTNGDIYEVSFMRLRASRQGGLFITRLV